ncbi:MAG: hypothetical protein IPN86_21245 [Saprospiraceae bacterium]|nr:hypothetical protein [Saprospiraceae bacterium]
MISLANIFVVEATPDEAMQLEDWKQISKENQLYFDNMQQAFLMVSNVEWSAPDKKAAWQKVQR